MKKEGKVTSIKKSYRGLEDSMLYEIKVSKNQGHNTISTFIQWKQPEIEVGDKVTIEVRKEEE